MDILSVGDYQHLFYIVVCWEGSISNKDSSWQHKLIRWAGSVVGMKMDSLVTLAEIRKVNKLLAILDDAQPSSAHQNQQPESLLQQQDVVPEEQHK